jgi:hypothetical protein
MGKTSFGPGQTSYRINQISYRPDKMSDRSKKISYGHYQNVINNTLIWNAYKTM